METSCDSVILFFPDKVNAGFMTGSMTVLPPNSRLKYLTYSMLGQHWFRKSSGMYVETIYGSFLKG